MMQYPQQQPTKAIGTREGSDTVFVSVSSHLFTGTAPFCWSADAYVQQIDKLAPQWFVTLHITAQGGNEQRVFQSETVSVVPSKIVGIPCPMNTVEPIPRNSYGMCAITAQFNDGAVIQPNTIGIRLIVVNGKTPVVEIVNTEIMPTWIIGAREIVLTDPPLMEVTPSASLQIEENVSVTV